MDVCVSQRADGIRHTRLFTQLYWPTEPSMTRYVTRHKDAKRHTSPAQRHGEELVEQAVVVLHKLGRDAELVVRLGVKVVLVELEHAGFEKMVVRLHEVGVRSTGSCASVPRIAAANVSAGAAAWKARGGRTENESG